MIGTLMAYPGWRCDLLTFFPNVRLLAFPYFGTLLTRQQLSLMFSAGMFFCTALNLP